MVLYFNINGGSGSGSSLSTTVEVLNDATGTVFTLATVISTGSYRVYRSNDAGVTYTLQSEGTNYTRSGQVLTFAVALTANSIKFEYTP